MKFRIKTSIFRRKIRRTIRRIFFRWTPVEDCFLTGELNPDALRDLYIAAYQARTAYDLLDACGEAWLLPGFSTCVDRLEHAIKKAENKNETTT